MDTIQIADDLNDLARKVSVIDAAIEGLDSTDWALTVPGLRELALEVRKGIETVSETVSATVHPPAAGDGSAVGDDASPPRSAVWVRMQEIGKALKLPKSELDEAMKSDDDMVAFARRHGQSLDYIVAGDTLGMIARLAPAPAGDDDDDEAEPRRPGGAAGDAGRPSAASDARAADTELENLLHNVRGLADSLIFMEVESGTGPAVHALGRTIRDMAETADDLRGKLIRH